jgi:hypothetical protein
MHDELRMKLATAEEELRNLDARRARILKQITRYKKALSSPQWWPTELIREIILLTVGQTPEFPLTGIDSRLLISQICARWRKVVFDTEIWDIDFDPGKSFQIFDPDGLPRYRRINPSCVFKLIGAWFSRYTGTKLSLKVVNHHPVSHSQAHSVTIVT